MAALDFKIADCHCDTIRLMGTANYDFGQQNCTGHIDLPRLRRGRVGLQFFALCVAPYMQHSYLHSALEQIAHYHRCLAANSRHLQSVENESDLQMAEREGRIAALLALEGAEPLENSLEMLEIFFSLGVRALSLTWNYRNQFADGISEEAAGGGLTRSGRKLVQALSGKGIILDLAHLSTRCFFEALDLTKRPPLVSHANARRICDHPRNLNDEQLKALASRGGVIGLSIYPRFISNKAEAGLEQLLDHFVYIAELIGVEHLAFGSDFDGIDCTVNGIRDVSEYAALPEALLERGFHPSEVELIAWGNVIRILRENLGGGAVP